jgi:hypothetical protein
MSSERRVVNGTVIAAAVALGFLGYDMARRSRLWPNALTNVSRRDIRRQMPR